MTDSVSRGLAVSLEANPRPFAAIVVGGLIVGVLDLTYAILVYSPQKPILIPQTIASGVLGMKSNSGGVQAAALGSSFTSFTALAPRLFTTLLAASSRS